MNAIDTLLKQLEECANASPLLLDFLMPTDTNDIGEILLRNLEVGTFQHELTIKDMARNYFNYADFVTNDTGFAMFFPRVGKLWNGKKPLEYHLISRDDFKTHLIDILAVGHIYTYPHSRISLQDAEVIIEKFFAEFTQKDKQWEVIWIKPDFLYTVEQSYDSGYIYQGYFENFGRDMAMAIKADNQIYLLLINGYA